MILYLSTVWADQVQDNGVIRRAERFDIHGLRPVTARPVVQVWRPDISAQFAAEEAGLESGHLGSCWALIKL